MSLFVHLKVSLEERGKRGKRKYITCSLKIFDSLLSVSPHIVLSSLKTCLVSSPAVSWNIGYSFKSPHFWIHFIQGSKTSSHSVRNRLSQSSFITLTQTSSPDKATLTTLLPDSICVPEPAILELQQWQEHTMLPELTHSLPCRDARRLI